MVLAIPYFRIMREGAPPKFIAYMPHSLIKSHKKGVRCCPARFRNGMPEKRRDHMKFFDHEGTQLMELLNWTSISIGGEENERNGEL